jgi:hypothetical protein
LRYAAHGAEDEVKEQVQATNCVREQGSCAFMEEKVPGFAAQCAVDKLNEGTQHHLQLGHAHLGSIKESEREL